MSTSVNGWSTYETWAVHLWLTNDEPRCVYCRALTAACRQSAPNCAPVCDGIWTPEQAATFSLAKMLRDLVERENPLSASPRVFADLIASALDNVDWNEIARDFLGIDSLDS